MKYTYPPSEYMKQLLAYNELESMSFKPEDSREYILEKLEERSEKKRVIADIANTMIREYIETFENDPDALTPEDAEKLNEFEDLLIPDGKRVGEISATDYGIYYRIGKILVRHYKREGDPDRYILALNRASLGFTVLINAHSFVWHTSPYREEIFSLFKKLGEYSLDGEARRKALITLVRSAFTGEELFNADELLEVLDILRSNFSEPMTGYELKILDSFYYQVLQMFREHCMNAVGSGITADTGKARPLLKEACDFLQKQKDSMSRAADDVNILITGFLLGEIPLDILLDGLIKLQNSACESENPLIQLQGLAMFNYYYLTILSKFSPLPKEEIIRQSRERIREVMPKLTKVSKIVNNVQFNRYIVEFLNAASPVGSFDEFADLILESTVYADKALYIHTVMVREMSRAIFDYLISKSPGIFEGVAGRDAEYIREHRREMRDLLDDCCMYHDIGKLFILDIVENSMRRLTDDEFLIIKEHPVYFNHICQTSGEEDERVRCIRDCALTHHLNHDGKGGYPDIPHTKNRPLVDILAIADSIDAATDFLGRPYKSIKTIDKLIGEFQSQAGTRYGEEAAAALSVPKVRDRLQYLITEGRKEIYYQIYAFNEIRTEI